LRATTQRDDSGHASGGDATTQAIAPPSGDQTYSVTSPPENVTCSAFPSRSVTQTSWFPDLVERNATRCPPGCQRGNHASPPVVSRVLFPPSASMTQISASFRRSETFTAVIAVRASRRATFSKRQECRRSASRRRSSQPRTQQAAGRDDRPSSVRRTRPVPSGFIARGRPRRREREESFRPGTRVERANSHERCAVACSRISLSRSITLRAAAPSSYEVKTMYLPSGDQNGYELIAESFVTWTTDAAAGGTMASSRKIRMHGSVWLTSPRRFYKVSLKRSYQVTLIYELVTIIKRYDRRVIAGHDIHEDGRINHQKR